MKLILSFLCAFSYCSVAFAADSPNISQVDAAIGGVISALIMVGLIAFYSFMKRKLPKGALIAILAVIIGIFGIAIFSSGPSQPKASQNPPASRAQPASSNIQNKPPASSQSGNGTITLKDGSKYTGAYKNNMPDGYGTRIEKDGTKYVGSYQQGRLHGAVTITYQNGRVLSGNFENGNLTNGAETYTDGNAEYSYMGDFANGQYNGQGIATRTQRDVNGNVQNYHIYEGQFKENQLFNGTDTASYPGTDLIIRSEFRNGVRLELKIIK